MIDPVSGNEVPPGAMPQEVRDNVPIAASEGEYVLPADVVRFIGLEKIEQMVNKAKQGMEQNVANGRVGGEPPTPMPPQEAPMPMPQMNTGGLVTDQDRQSALNPRPFYGSAAPAQGQQGRIEEYVGPNGEVLFIPFHNGRPLLPIPEGFNPKGAMAAQPDTSGETAQVWSDEGDRDPEQPLTGLAGSPDKWGPEDFINYSKMLGSPESKAAGLLTSFIPLGGLAYQARQNYLKTNVPNLLDQMIETGVDREGNPLAPEQLSQLSASREVIREKLSKETGIGGNPFEKLGSFVGRIGEALGIGGRQAPQRAVQAPSVGSAGVGAPRTSSPSVGAHSGSDDSDSGYTSPAVGSTTPTNQIGGGTSPHLGSGGSFSPSFDVGSSGRMSPHSGAVSAPSNLSMGTPINDVRTGGFTSSQSAGLAPSYRKGGLVTPRSEDKVKRFYKGGAIQRPK